MSMMIGSVADKILQLAQQQNGPISMEDIHERLNEPIGLIHLGISQLVRKGMINVVSQARRNYILARAAPVDPTVAASQLAMV